jgi:hypothetical protein
VVVKSAFCSLFRAEVPGTGSGGLFHVTGSFHILFWHNVQVNLLTMLR